jgi:hypothetical protein
MINASLKISKEIVCITCPERPNFKFPCYKQHS